MEALIAAIPAIFSMFSGFNEKNSAQAKLSELEKNRPKYQIPDQAKQALSMALSQTGNMPGFTAQQERIDVSAANMIQNAVLSGNPLAALGSIQANQNKAGTDLTTRNAEYRITAADRATQALGTYAGYKDMQFQMNEFAPWKDQYQMNQNRFGAGSKNMYSGLDSISSIASAYLTKG